MSIAFDIDYPNIESAARSNAILSGADVFGPRERCTGSTDHVFRRSPSGLILHVQNFKVSEVFLCRAIRRGQLTMQFIVCGGYRQGAGERPLRVCPGTIRISANAQSDVSVPRHNFLGVGICVDPRLLIDAFGLLIDSVPDVYRPLFNPQLGSAPVMELAMDACAWVAIQEIMRCKFREPLRSEYMNARTTELVCYAVAEINKLRRCDRLVGVAAATRERTKIEMAEAIYRTELSKPPSLPEVACRVGLNRNKLVAGFREQFNTTPHDYSRQFRLRRARDMLVGGAVAIERIAAATGYTSHAAFTRAFKDEFGYPPSETRIPPPAPTPPRSSPSNLPSLERAAT